MDIEQQNNELNDQVVFPRILFEEMEQYRGRQVTLIGSVYNEDAKDSLVLQCGPTGTDCLVIVDNRRKVDINNTTQLVEVRGLVLNQNMIKMEELTEFEQKEAFDFDTYRKFVQLTTNDKLRSLYFDN